MNIAPPRMLFEKDSYSSPRRRISWLNKRCPELLLYLRLGRLLLSGGRLGQQKAYTGVTWASQSETIVRILELAGCRFEVEGLDSFRKLDTPCVFAANHMSTLETMCLPAMIQPTKNMTFVVKKSLMSYPYFKDLLSARNPIALARENPRDDFKLVMEKGTQLLKEGVSIVIFPQGARLPVFKPSEFNSIAVKLAKHAGVPIVPVALQTRAWGQGRLISDIGPLFPKYPVRFRFGKPLSVTGNGREEQATIIRFIGEALAEWSDRDPQ